MAKWLCRTSDRHLAPRVPGPNGHLQRGAPAANSFRLCDVLQSSAHALGITERCPLASNRPRIWRHCRHSDLGWAASPIRPDMIFGKDTSRSTAKSSCGYRKRGPKSRRKRRHERTRAATAIAIAAKINNSSLNFAARIRVTLQTRPATHVRGAFFVRYNFPYLLNCYETYLLYPSTTSAMRQSFLVLPNLAASDHPVNRGRLLPLQCSTHVGMIAAHETLS